MKFATNHQTEVLEEVLVKEQVVPLNDLIIYNDDFNTFDFVIQSLVEICKHDLLQAEQCAYIVHYNGKCAVKADSFENLKPLCSELLNRGLTAEIE